MIKFDLKKLNIKQRQAITTTEIPVCVIAGAGSGKTAVIVNKILYLIQNKKVPLEKICAITFTRKAAKEMLDRVEAVLPNFSRFALQLSTYHSLCRSILKADLVHNHYDRNFAVMNASQIRQLLRHILQTASNVWGMTAWQERNKVINKIINMISSAKRNNIFAGTPLSLDNYQITFLQQYHIDFDEVYLKYEEQKARLNYFDFDDLILHTNHLFKSYPQIKRKWQNRFEYFLVDEFQDTNLGQYNLINLLCARSNKITVVGDPDQNIYSWRGARSKLITEFKANHPQAQLVILDQNYRSTSHILNLADRFIKNNKNRVAKKLVTDKAAGIKPKLVACSNEYTEAEWVASQIKGMIQEKLYHKKDVMILYRSNYTSRRFESALSLRGIDYEVVGDLKFWERQEILTCLSLLRSLISPNDTLAVIPWLKRCPGIGDSRLSEILNFLQDHNLNVYELLNEHLDQLSNPIANRLRPLQKVFADNPIDNCRQLGPYLEQLAKQLGWLDSANKIFENPQISNIKEMILQLAQYDTEEPDSVVGANRIANFLDVMSIDTIDNQDKTTADSVKLLTIHKAKGLESKVVFIVTLNDGIFPIGSTYPGDHLDEERRVLYVAMTRAQEVLYITYNYGYNMLLGKENKPSLFVNELHQDHYEEINLYTSTAFGADRVNQQSNHAVKFSKNMRVKHPIYGVGTIVHLMSSKLVYVAFDDRLHGKRVVSTDDDRLTKIVS